MTERAGPAGSSPAMAGAASAFASGVTLVTVADGRDDVGTTVSAFCPVSADPPLVLVSLIASSYPAELLGRVDRFAVTVLAADQRVLAGRFAVSGRPGARLLLDGVPHQRGTLSGALIPAGGLAALECGATQRVVAGDHLLVIARVLDVPYLAENGQPLIRFRGKYPPLSPGSPALSGPARPRYRARHTRPARHGILANSHPTQRPSGAPNCTRWMYQ